MCITDSAILDSVGSKLIGLQFEMSDFKPERLYTGQTWASLKISGNIPLSNMLLNMCVKVKDIGVAIIEMYLPGRPQCDVLDFFISLHAQLCNFYVRSFYSCQIFNNIIPWC